MSGTSGRSSPTHAQAAGVSFSRTHRRVSAASLSPTPCSTWRTPSSRQRAATIGERRPEITAISSPARCSSLSPTPSRTWNALRASPRGPKYSRPSVSTPSTSSTSRRMAGAMSDDASAHQIVHVECADEPPLGIRYRERRDAMYLHQVRGFGSELTRPDALRVRGHDGTHQRGVHVDLLIERAPQVAVGEDAEDVLPRIDHHGHAEALARHLQESGSERLIGRDARDGFTGAHQILDVQQQPAPERASRM